MERERWSFSTLPQPTLLYYYLLFLKKKKNPSLHQRKTKLPLDFFSCVIQMTTFKKGRKRGFFFFSSSDFWGHSSTYHYVYFKIPFFLYHVNFYFFHVRLPFSVSHHIPSQLCTILGASFVSCQWVWVFLSSSACSTFGAFVMVKNLGIDDPEWSMAISLLSCSICSFSFPFLFAHGWEWEIAEGKGMNGLGDELLLCAVCIMGLKERGCVLLPFLFFIIIIYLFFPHSLFFSRFRFFLLFFAFVLRLEWNEMAIFPHQKRCISPPPSSFLHARSQDLPSFLLTRPAQCSACGFEREPRWFSFMYLHALRGDVPFCAVEAWGDIWSAEDGWVEDSGTDYAMFGK